MSAWQPMETAPRDGTQILVARDNDCFHEYDVVWWSPDKHGYPWQADGTAYPENRLDMWAPIASPTLHT